MRLAMVLLVLLLASCDNQPTKTGRPPPSLNTSSPSPSRAASPATGNPTPSRTTAEGRLELRGDDLGVTRVGAPKREAVAAVSSVLGVGDTSATARDCIDSYSSAAWKDLVLSFDRSGRLNGWQVDTPRVATPAGVRVGTTVATLRRVYGRQVTFFPADSDNSPSYEVRGVDITGYLSSEAATGRVTSLVNGACHGA